MANFTFVNYISQIHKIGQKWQVSWQENIKDFVLAAFSI